MKQNISLGVVCLGRKTFDYKAAESIYKTIMNDLKELENVNCTCVEDFVIEIEDARKAADAFASQNVDAVVVISGTFHLGHLVLEIDKVLRKPILLWGLNELPYDGGKIRLNSVCGVNLNASNLYKSGNRQYRTVISDKIDENWIDAIRGKKALEEARIGVLGDHAHGFFNLAIDELNTLQQTGMMMNHYELKDVFDTTVEEQAINEEEIKIRGIFDVSGITDEQVKKVAMLCIKMRTFITSNHLTAVAIRCWPEFARDYGISPCAAMSVLQSEGLVLGCEGDVEGTMSMIMHRAVGGKTPFLADLSQVNFEENYALLWHCGVAPCNLWDGKCNRSLDTYFAGGKGVTADFVMKSGEVSVLRLDSSQGQYRVFLQKGNVVPMEKLLKGTYAKVNFEESIKDVMDLVIYNGVAHHISVVYGEYLEPFKILAQIKGWEIIE